MHVVVVNIGSYPGTFPGTREAYIPITPEPLSRKANTMRNLNIHKLSYLQALDAVNEQLSRARSLIVATADAVAMSPRYAAVIASVLEMRAARKYDERNAAIESAYADNSSEFSSSDLAWFRSPIGAL